MVGRCSVLTPEPDFSQLYVSQTIHFGGEKNKLSHLPGIELRSSAYQPDPGHNHQATQVQDEIVPSNTFVLCDYVMQ